MTARTAQNARVLVAAVEALKAWDADERAMAARFKAETGALRSDFDKAMAALGTPHSGAPVTVPGSNAATLWKNGAR